MNARRAWLRTLGAMALGHALPAPAVETREYPWRTVTIVQPFGAGNVLDVCARILAPHLAHWLGQAVIVDTHVGAGGNIASGIVARAAPDGHMLLIHGVGVVLQALIHNNSAVDPLTALTPVMRLSTQPMFVTVNPSLGVRTLGELVEHAKRDPGGIAYGTSGVGGIQHCSTLMFCQRAGIELLHVPFPNSAQIYSNLLSGEVPLAFAFAGSVEAHLHTGKLIALAVTSAKRNAAMPEVPTIAESGYPGYVANAWTAISTTGGTPAATVARIHHELMRALALPDIREMFVANGAVPLGDSPAEFAAEIETSQERWGPLLRPIFPNSKSS